jgi:hypothetical protein
LRLLVAEESTGARAEKRSEGRILERAGSKMKEKGDSGHRRAGGRNKGKSMMKTYMFQRERA